MIGKSGSCNILTAHAVEGCAMPSDSSVEAALLELMGRELGRSVRVDDRLSSLGVDSVAMAEFIGTLEKRLQFEADAEILDVDTVDELVHYIDARRK